MKHLITTLVLALSLSGCATINHLKTEVDELSRQKENLCAAVLEITTGFRFLYLGDMIFYDQMTGQKIGLKSLIPSCDNFLESFKEDLEKRKEDYPNPPLPRPQPPTGL